MCGLAGFTCGPDPDTAASTATLRRQLAPIASRGPDQEGFHTAPGIALGHLRLSIVDLAGGRQPRVNEATGDALVFNGEIYGYRALRADLIRRGIAIEDASDTEVLFQLLCHDGIEATLARIDGMFAFAYFEGRRRRLHLARDRFGEKPLYWCDTGGDIVFGSEPRAVLAHPACAALPVDPGAVALFLDFEYLPGDRSLRRGLRKLPAGHRLEFARGWDATVVSYWRPDPRQRGHDGNARGEAERVDRLDCLLNTAIEDRLVADVPVGVFLSGGIDSSLVAAVAAKKSPGITAFTVRMPEASYDETRAAHHLASTLGMRHEVVDLDDASLLDAFDAMTARMDEPLADASLLPTYVLCRAARRYATVALGGDGADELFAGYVSFKADRAARLLALMPKGLGRLARALLARLPQKGGYMAIEFLLHQLSQGFGLPPERQWSACMAPFAPEEQDRLWHPAARADSAAARTDPVGDLFAARGRPSWTTAELLHLFTTTYLPEDILQKVDRASMAVSLEVRSPFLARDFAEYALALPSNDKIRGLSTKALFRKLALRHIPAEIVARRKHGFAIPLTRLLRGPLAAPVGDTLLEPASPLREWFAQREIERLWREHHSGARDHRKKIWTLFTLATAIRNTQDPH